MVGRRSCCSPLDSSLTLEVASEELTTIPESADEVEVVDEADEEEQCSRDSAEFELYPETKRKDNYIWEIYFCLQPLFFLLGISA